MIALVPLRTGGKSRLGAALLPEQREALVLAMLADVVLALQGAGVTDVRILAGTSSAVAAADARGLVAIPDPLADVAAEPGAPQRGDVRLRAAVDAALAHVPAMTTRMVVAADLPRLTSGEVASVLADPAEVVVAPTSGGGTSVLRLAPGVLLPARYGPGSAGAHVAAAEQAGYRVSVLDLPGGLQDVDAAADLEALVRGPLGTAPGPATATFLAGAHG